MWPSPPKTERWPSDSHPPPSGFRGVAGKRQGQRWTITKEFVRDGFCYRLIRRPVDAADDGGPRLTKREEEALACACNGYSNKRIAQCLDVAPSTVGVLLFRASTKLGVKSRRELVAAYQRLKTARTSNVTPFDRSRLQKSK